MSRPGLVRDPQDVARYDEELGKVTIGGARPLTQPIEIHDYDPDWPLPYEREEARIKSILGDRVMRIERVGSTAVPALEAAGYVPRIREPEWYEHRMLNGPDTAVNVHVFAADCPEVDRMLLFRDWLRTNAADRDRYADAKRELAAREWKYVQQYAEAKSEVVGDIMGRAH